MAVFNWNQTLKALPDAWRTTEGENVKIAILDSGIDLTHPGLSHLDVAGQKFNAAQPGFDPNGAGDDDVDDAVPFMSAHGTHVSSIIAAKPVEEEGVKGVAPKAEVYSIKITDDNKQSFLKYFINGMKVALLKNVDVVSVSYFPIFQDPVDQAAIDDIFSQVVAKKIAFVTTLQNTSKFNRLNNLKFPATRTENIVTGVVREKLLQDFPDNAVFNSNIYSVFPEMEATYCTLFRSNKYITSKLTCSYSTAALAGVVALMIAHWKKTEQNYQRRTKAEIMQALTQCNLPFNAQQMLNNPVFQYYKT